MHLIILSAIWQPFCLSLNVLMVFSFVEGQKPIRSLIFPGWHHMASYMLVNINSGKGLLPDDTKLSLEKMFTWLHWSIMALNWWEFHKKLSRYQSLKPVFMSEGALAGLDPFFFKRWSNDNNEEALLTHYHVVVSLLDDHFFFKRGLERPLNHSFWPEYC